METFDIQRELPFRQCRHAYIIGLQSIRKIVDTSVSGLHKILAFFGLLALAATNQLTLVSGLVVTLGLRLQLSLRDEPTPTLTNSPGPQAGQAKPILAGFNVSRLRTQTTGPLTDPVFSTVQPPAFSPMYNSILLYSFADFRRKPCS
jgi:hypothetical protein